MKPRVGSTEGKYIYYDITTKRVVGFTIGEYRWNKWNRLKGVEPLEYA